MTTFWAPKCTSTARLYGKTAIITGCNTGIGKVTAKDFCKRGCRVIMACRNIEKAKEAKNDILKEILEEIEQSNKIGVLIVKKLDLSSLKSVRKCAKKILEEEPRIDLLINNGGVFACPQSTTEDGYETQFATNHLGHFLFTLLLLPRIIASAPARIVNLSSSGHDVWGDKNFEDINYEIHDYTPFGAYGRSKLANILFTKELAKRLQGKEVNVYAVHPGLVQTEAQRHWKKAHPYLRIIGEKLMDLIYRSPKQGAQTTIYCAVDEEVKNETGLYYENCKRSKPSRDARDSELAKKLWDLSVEWVKLGDFDPFKAEDEGPKLI